MSGRAVVLGAAVAAAASYFAWTHPQVLHQLDGTLRSSVTRPVRGSSVTAVGDSVMLASAPALERALPGVAVNAVVGRQFATGVQVVAWLAGHHELRRVVVVGLGTNGPVTPGQMQALLSVTGRRRLVLVNTYEARPWEHEVNSELAATARRHSRVTLVNWHAGIAGRPWMLADGIHPGPGAAQIYARLVAAGVRGQP